MRFQPYLRFNGECRAAFELYERCFGGTLETVLTYGESPMAAQTPPELGDKILHVTLTVGDEGISGADVPPDRYQKPAGFEVLINVLDAQRAERIFNTLADGGLVQVPLQQTFWAARFGTVVDRFGITWTINCGAPT